MEVQETKHRRAHEKSRKGCMRCKKQRKKCDEAHPICSRCKKRNYCCQYSAQGSRLNPEPSEDLERSYSTLEASDPGYLSHLSISPSSSESFPNSISSSQSGIDSVSAHPAIPSQSSPTPRMLNSRELELLSHYVMHTSRTIPVGDEDLYVLNVVIPNLAFGSEPVMASILALSAACRCRDLLDQSEGLERLEEISQLLDLADKHHQMSLRQIQVAIHNVDHVDSVLANAALMVLYGLANHSVRVSLAAKGEREGNLLQYEVLPLQSQWLTLIRAAYTAYVGLLNDLPEEPSMVPPSSWSRKGAPDLPSVSIHEIHTPQDGPSPSTKSLLMPIVSATYRSALQDLDARVRSVVTGDIGAVANARRVVQPGLGASVTSFMLLEDIFTETFAQKPSTSEDFHSQSETPISNHLHTGRLQKASPWLANYLARVTSAQPSKILRRSITAFLNRVPREYLQLVQSVLDCMPSETNQPGSEFLEEDLPLGIAHRLAMDIFAHWLVLVMLLDGVWWIGGIGQWELRRVVAFAGNRGWIPEFTKAGSIWWPESMYNVKTGLEKPTV